VNPGRIHVPLKSPPRPRHLEDMIVETTSFNVDIEVDVVVDSEDVVRVSNSVRVANGTQEVIASGSQLASAAASRKECMRSKFQPRGPPPAVGRAADKTTKRRRRDSHGWLGRTDKQGRG
jgi:hypothetical protein